MTRFDPVNRNRWTRDVQSDTFRARIQIDSLAQSTLLVSSVWRLPLNALHHVPTFRLRDGLVHSGIGRDAEVTQACFAVCACSVICWSCRSLMGPTAGVEDKSHVWPHSQSGAMHCADRNRSAAFPCPGRLGCSHCPSATSACGVLSLDLPDPPPLKNMCGP